MKDFDQILDECVEEILNGSSTLAQCLVRYPEEAAELEPLLRAAVMLDCGRELRPGAGFKAEARMQLYQYMQAHPRQPSPPKSFPPPLRVFLSLTALILALLISGTAYAQGSLPGDSFYSWKITSEHAWRAVSPDPVGIDLILAERRVREYQSVAGDPQRSQRALQEYSRILVRLKSASNAYTRSRIEPVIKNQEKSFKDSGIIIPELEIFFSDPAAAGPGNGSNPPQPANSKQPELPDSVPPHVQPTAGANPGGQAGSTPGPEDTATAVP